MLYSKSVESAKQHVLYETKLFDKREQTTKIRRIIETPYLLYGIINAAGLFGLIYINKDIWQKLYSRRSMMSIIGSVILLPGLYKAYQDTRYDMQLSVEHIESIKESV